MGFVNYLKHSLWDFVLCACASSALCYVCLIAFVATHSLQDSPLLIIGCCTALSAVLFAIAYNTRTALVGSALLAIVLVAIAVMCWTASPAESIVDDVAGNNVYLVILVTICSVLTFVLSRRKVGALVLLVGGLVVCALMEYLYWDGQLVASAVFGVSAAVLYAYRNYQSGLAGSDSERLLFDSVTGVSAAMAAISVLLAVGVFAVLVAPLDPPSVVVKLLTRHVQLDEVEVRGTGDEVSIRNDLLFSILADGTVQSRSEGEGTDDDREETDEDPQSEEEQQQDVAGATFGLDNTGDDAAEAVSMQLPEYWPVLALLLVVLIVALVIAARKMIRQRWRRRTLELPADMQVKRYFLYFVNSLGKMKVPQPSNQTLREYLDSLRGQLSEFEGSSEPEFLELADTYSRCVYGKAPMSPEETARFDRYYEGFHHHARRFVGPIKYLALFFKI